MASTNKTITLQLSQFTTTDKPSWLTDYNNDMEKIDTFAASVDGDISQAVSDADNAKTIAQTASTTAQQAQTAATQAQSAATQAQSTATQAQSAATQAQSAANSVQTSFNQTVNGWKTSTIINPDTTNYVFNSQMLSYNKQLGLLHIAFNMAINNNKQVSNGTPIATLPTEVGGSNALNLPGCAFCSVQSQRYSEIVPITLTQNGQLVFGGISSRTDLTYCNINVMIGMAGQGNGWVDAAT